MKALQERIFRLYKRRFLPLVTGLTIIGTWIILAVSDRLGGSFGPLEGLMTLGLLVTGFYVLVDRLGLFGNGWLKKRVQGKLEALGELPEGVDSPQVRFVGLALPVREGWFRAESDVDVGFLEITAEGLRYRGDALSFDVPAEDLEEVTLIYRLPAFKRVLLHFRGHEPFDSICLDSRDSNRFFAAKRDNTALYRALQTLIRSQPPRERLPAPVEEAEEVEALAQEVSDSPE